MADPNFYMIMAAATLVGLAMLVYAGLTGWRGWLDLQRQQLSGGAAGGGGSTPAGARIEIADLKERIRKLEAIAAGVEF